jgi:CRP-like cAMP-binding protein
MSARLYPNGTMIFEEGTPAAGVYVVESGQVKLLLQSGNIRPQVLEVAGPGTILGLSETMSHDNYRVTAQADDQATVAFIPQQKFMEFLRVNREFCMQIVRILSQDLHALYHKFRSVSAHPGRPRHRPEDEYPSWNHPA